ncbi:MAG: CBS domain-containing protein [Promethearchaeota archaeon]|nr:MAG: CBS domain-containing protein [Candidatus Lokiarchaeota archaeon]
MGENHRSLNRIKVSEFMIRDPYFTVPDEKISATERLMLRKNVGGLPVVMNNKNKKIIGIITQRDIRLARFATNLDSPNTQVKDLMTPEPITLKQEDTFGDALEKMITKRIERLPVINPNNELIGLITKQSILERLFKFLKDTNT